MRRTKPRLGPPIIGPDRIRSIRGCGFAFIPDRFLQGDELALYLLRILAGDRSGLSFYPYDSLCSLAGMTLERYYLAARGALIDKDLVAFDGSRFQVLSLPNNVQPPPSELPLQTQEEFEDRDPATVRLLIRDSLRDAMEKAT